MVGLLCVFSLLINQNEKYLVFIDTLVSIVQIFSSNLVVFYILFDFGSQQDKNYNVGSISRGCR